MTGGKLKYRAIEFIPYAAVFGVAALAIYGITKVMQAVNDIDFPLDFGYDPRLDEFLDE